MEVFTMLVDNYKNTTRGLNIFVRIIFALALFFIFSAVIMAFVNVIINGVEI